MTNTTRSSLLIEKAEAAIAAADAALAKTNRLLAHKVTQYTVCPDGVRVVACECGATITGATADEAAANHEQHNRAVRS